MAGPVAVRLHEIGLYEWGSLVIRMHALAPVERKKAAKMLAALTDFFAVWDTPGEFRGFVSLTHEVVHYFQDLTTGVGHHDELVRRRERRRSLTESQMRSYGVDPARAAETAAKVVDAEPGEPVQEQLVLPPAGDRARVFAARVRAVPQMTLDEHLSDFHVMSLLEAEATLSAHILCASLRTDAAGRDMLYDHLTLWYPPAMQEAYSSPVTTLLRMVMHIFGMGQDSTESIYKGLLLSARLVPYLIDLSCAYPARQTMERSGMPPEEFEPGLKLVRLLLALHRADAGQTGDFVRAVKAHDYGAAEPILLRHCPATYPTSAEIYSDWVDVLDDAHRRWNDPVLRVRRQAAELRLKEPYRFVNKHVGELVFAPLPLLWHKDGKIQMLYSNHFFSNPQELSELLNELDARELDRLRDRAPSVPGRRKRSRKM